MLVREDRREHPQKQRRKKVNEWLNQINECSARDACLDVCPTYKATGNSLFSPKGRLDGAHKVLIDIAKNLLVQASTEELVSPCPFCTFNLNYTSKNAGIGKGITYITKVIWESLG
jgi:Fe-S oxidoreductase